MIGSLFWDKGHTGRPQQGSDSDRGGWFLEQMMLAGVGIAGLRAEVHVGQPAGGLEEVRKMVESGRSSGACYRSNNPQAWRFQGSSG